MLKGIEKARKANEKSAARKTSVAAIGRAGRLVEGRLVV